MTEHRQNRHVSAILNSWWMVRHYGHARSIQRKQAIQRLGLTIREAFASSDDFEELLRAVVEGCFPQDIPPF